MPCGVNPPGNCEDLTLPPPTPIFRTKICTEAHPFVISPLFLAQLFPHLIRGPGLTPIILRYQSPTWNFTQMFISFSSSRAGGTREQPLPSALHPGP